MKRRSIENIKTFAIGSDVETFSLLSARHSEATAQGIVLVQLENGRGNCVHVISIGLQGCVSADFGQGALT